MIPERVVPDSDDFKIDFFSDSDKDRIFYSFKSAAISA